MGGGGGGRGEGGGDALTTLRAFSIRVYELAHPSGSDSVLVTGKQFFN